MNKVYIPFSSNDRRCIVLNELKSDINHIE